MVGVSAEEGAGRKEWSIAIHGGAGVLIDKGDEQAEAAYHAILERSIRAGAAVLARGAPGEEAVAAAIVVMEDSPRFNCGHGSSVTMDGVVETDAAIMRGDGDQTRAGAVCSARAIRNPITAAKAVMADDRFVLLAADGADRYAREAGLAMAEPDYFIADWRWQLHLDNMPAEPGVRPSNAAGAQPARPELGFGTVGAVVLDSDGNLCAGTSTGGLNNKQFGRVGDSPIFGAGTYASNDSCAVSCTGAGENFIKEAAAHSVAGRMRWGGASLAEAADAVIFGEHATVGGVSGGLVAMDRSGQAVFPFNSAGMYRGSMDSESDCATLIWPEEGEAGRERKPQRWIH